MEISFVIVNHKSENYLEKCLFSLEKFLFNIKYEVILINNDSEELAENFLIKKDNFFIHNTRENLGYAKANNIGARFCKGDIICFLNPDTVILNCDIKKVLHLLKNEVSILGPSLVLNHKLELQAWSTGTEVTLWETIKNNSCLGKSHLLWENENPIETAWVSGACLFIRKSLFEKLNGFDEKFFLYFEDVDLCRRAKKEKGKVLFFPEMKVLHWGGKSSQNAKKQKSLYYKSQDYYFEKHFGIFSKLAIKVLRAFFQR